MRTIGRAIVVSCDARRHTSRVCVIAGLAAHGLLAPVLGVLMFGVQVSVRMNGSVAVTMFMFVAERVRGSGRG